MNKFRIRILLTLAALALAAGAYVAYRKIPTAEERARVELRQELAARMQAGVFADPDSGNVIPWRLYVPPEASHSQPLPLIIAFHAGGGRGSDNLRQLDDTIRHLLSDALQGIEPVLILAPQAGDRTHWVDYPTFDPPFENFDQRQIPQSENIKSSIRLLRETMSLHNVDPARVYVTGISMGGEGSWDSLTYYPELFAAALILNGAGDPRAMDRVKGIPIRYFHGATDLITPVKNSRELDVALRAVGANAQYTELPEGGHNIRDQVYTRENFAWLLQQRRSE